MSPELSRKLAQALGFPKVDESYELDAHISSLALPGTGAADVASAPSPLAAEPEPSPEAMGDNDVKNILYLNFKPTNIPEEAKAQLAKLTAEMDLNTNWLSLRAGMETQKQITARKLPGDMSDNSQQRRSTYRAKITDYLIQNSSWMGVFQNQAMSRDFSVRKDEFHLQLLTVLFQGLTLSSSVFGKVEAILTEISNTIQQFSESTAKSMYWVLLTVFTWDNVQKIIRPTVRTIYFEADSNIKSYVSNKHNIQQVNLHMAYMQMDAIFNNAVFENGIQQNISAFLGQAGVAIVNQPIDIPVDP